MELREQKGGVSRTKRWRRTSLLGDTFCRDGYHLELTYGRYTAACTWFEKLFGISAIGNPFYPISMFQKQAKIAQYSAHYAVKNSDFVVFPMLN